MTAASALDLCASLIGVAVAVQSLELLALRARFASSGFWSWNLLREEFLPASRGVRWLLDTLFRTRNFEMLLTLRLFAAMGLIGWTGAGTGASLEDIPKSSVLAALSAYLAFSTLAIAFRWRGTFNGGSDAMTLIVLLGLVVGYGWPSASDVATHAGLAYIAFQCTLSYFIAGAVKLRAQDWRNGRALQTFLNLPGYPVPQALRELSKNMSAMRAMSWGLIAWECAFPLVFVYPRFFLATGLLFHLANAFSFGLNRFLLAWVAAYPALWYWAGTLTNIRG